MLFVYTGQDRISKGKHCHEYYEYINREPNVVEATNLEEVEKLLIKLDVFNFRVYEVSKYPVIDYS